MRCSVKAWVTISPVVFAFSGASSSFEDPLLTLREAITAARHDSAQLGEARQKLGLDLEVMSQNWHEPSPLSLAESNTTCVLQGYPKMSSHIVSVPSKSEAMGQQGVSICTQKGVNSAQVNFRQK